MYVYGKAGVGLGLGLNRRQWRDAIAGLSVYSEAWAITSADTFPVVPLADDVTIKTFPDLAGRGNVLTSPTINDEGRYFSDVINGYPVVRFDGINEYMRTLTGLAFNGNEDFHLFVVLIPYDSGFDANWASGGDPTGGSFQFLDDRQAGPLAKQWGTYYTDAGVQSQTEAGTYAYGVPILAELRVEGATMTSLRNGVQVLTKVLAGNRVAGERDLFLASMRGQVVDGFYGKIDVAAVAFADTALSAGDVSTLRAALMNRYGLS